MIDTNEQITNNVDMGALEPMENELAIIDGIPATPFHQSIIKLAPFRSFSHFLQCPCNQKSSTTANSAKASMNEKSGSIHQSLRHDCNLAFTARPKEEDAAYSAGSTFFIPCETKPRCLLEALALDVFHAHADSIGYNQNKKKDKSGISFDPARSGAEWWTLVMDASPNSDSNTSDEKSGTKSFKTDDHEDDDSASDISEDEEDDVGMHFDADYGLEDVLPSLIHPHFSTVTYLSNVGVPTLVLNKASPPPEDVETKQSLNGSISKGYLSYPKYGKHIAFDGRLLHGASALFFPSCSDVETTTITTTPDQSLKRVTFMVNVWFNHKPIDADLLPNEILNQMTPCPWHAFPKAPLDESQSPTKKLKQENDTASYNSKDHTSPYITSGVTSPDSLTTVTLQKYKKEPKEIQTVICGREVSILFQSNTFRRSAHAIRNSDSLELIMEKDCLSLQVGEEVVYSSDEDEDE